MEPIMKINENLQPTQAYPKILWYQVKYTLPTEEQKTIIYNRHFYRLVDAIVKEYPTASVDDVYESAKNQAKTAAEDEINRPYMLKKVVVKTFMEHQTMTQMIENSDDFIQWYKK